MAFIRKIIQKTGFDFHRHYPQANKMSWFKDENIKTVLDIGANVGQFAKEIRIELPDAFIYSFEPLKECFDKLKTIENRDDKFKAYNFAIGDKEESVNMNKSSYTPSSSLLNMAESHKTLFPHTKDSSPEEIEVRKLDSVFSELKIEGNILIKVDTQGYEDKVINGGMNTFTKAKILIIESSFIQLYENQPLFDNIYQKLKLIGFNYKGALHQKIDKKTGKILFEDSIYTK